MIFPWQSKEKAKNHTKCYLDVLTAKFKSAVSILMLKKFVIFLKIYRALLNENPRGEKQSEK